MRISPARTCRRSAPAAGFTLVEMLMVMVVMALMMFLALPAFHIMLRGDLQKEVNRLTGVIRLLRNEAVLTHTDFRLMWDLKEGRYFVEEKTIWGDYVPRQDPPVLRSHPLPESFDLKDIVVFGEMSRKERDEVVPIIIDSSGYIDPFVLHFSEDEVDYTLKVAGFTGRVELLEGYDEE